ncbi:MAG: hypothetical protein QXM31_00735 [Candidatus Woesearchaeota archaeon]
MKKADFWFIVVVLAVFLAIIVLLLNINALFPTPGAEELAKSVVPQ